MGSGTLIELIARGKQDIPITGNPQISYFKTVYHRHTNFAVEPIRNVFNETPNFGKKTTCYIDKKADLLGAVYLEIQLPQITNSAGWVNGIGNRIIKNVELQIGGETIDQITGDSLDVYNEMIVAPGIKTSYYDMVGKQTTYGPGSLTTDLLLYVPLPFWFCRDIGRSLPLINLGYMDVSIVVELEEFDNLWYKNGNTPNNPNSISVTSMYLLCNYIYLDTHERRKMLAKPQIEYLIEQFQEPPNMSVLENQVSFSHQIYLNHPVKEIIWYYQSFFAQDKNATNNYANILSPNNPNQQQLIEPFTTVELKFNGNDRFNQLNAKYFRTVQPYEHHTSSPDTYVYLFSFALNPEVNQPSGTCNFSKIDDVRLNLGLCSNILPGNIYMLAVNYNILRIQSGMAGLLYSS